MGIGGDSLSKAHADSRRDNERRRRTMMTARREAATTTIRIARSSCAALVGCFRVLVVVIVRQPLITKQTDTFE